VVAVLVGAVCWAGTVVVVVVVGPLGGAGCWAGVVVVAALGGAVFDLSYAEETGVVLGGSGLDVSLAGGA
jgi:hypothetical protein